MEPVEIASETLYVVGGNVPLNGRITWVPSTATGFQPMNCYLLVENGSAVIVDPGPAAVEGSVVAGLKRAVPRGVEPDVFLTRYQLDAIGNLGPIATAIPLGVVYTGGLTNPFDSFDQVTSMDAGNRTRELQVARIAPRTQLDVGPERKLEVVTPLIRILSTFWVYDTGTKTLFTSDAFTHGLVSDEADVPVIRDAGADVSLEHVRAHLLATFGWLEQADTEPIIENLRRIFEEREIEIIAPARGCILHGRDVVDQHYSAVLDVLKGLVAV
jgi:flavorubredoxin